MTEAAADVTQAAAAADDATRARQRRERPFGGLTPAEAGRIGGRNRAAAREREANERTAGPVDAGELLRVQRRLLELAQGQHGASPTVQVQAARALHDWAKLGAPAGAGVDVPATREERAAERAALLLAVQAA